MHDCRKFVVTSHFLACIPIGELREDKNVPRVPAHFCC